MRPSVQRPILRPVSKVIILKITTPTGEVIRSFVRSEAEAYSLVNHWDPALFIVELEEHEP